MTGAKRKQPKRGGASAVPRLRFALGVADRRSQWCGAVAQRNGYAAYIGQTSPPRSSGSGRRR